jgi:hypothetical protein
MGLVGHPSVAFFRDLERKRLQALVDGDLELARSMHSDDYQLIRPGGGVLLKDEYLAGIASGELDYAVFEAVSEIAVRRYVGAAAVRYEARIVVRVDGQLDSGRFWHTDIYEFVEGRWQATWSQATRVRAADENSAS